MNLSVLQSEKAPFAITFILGVLGWLITHTVDRILDSPTLEYRFSVEQQSGKEIATLNLTNVTRDKQFENVSVIMKADAPVQGQPEIGPVEPAFEGNESPTPAGQSATFSIPAIAPGAGLVLKAGFAGNGEVALRIWSTGKSAMRTTRADTETFVARHEIGILLLLFVAWLLILILVTFGLFRAPTRAGAKSEEASEGDNNALEALRASQTGAGDRAAGPSG